MQNIFLAYKIKIAEWLSLLIFRIIKIKNSNHSGSKLRHRFHANQRVVMFTLFIISGLLFSILFIELLKPRAPAIFIGMDIGYGDEHTAIRLVDEVEDYVNLIVLGSLELTNDTEALGRVCEYIYQKDLYFIVFVSFAEYGYVPPRGPDPDFFEKAIQKWGDKFLGVYLFDEVGGRLIDNDHSIDIGNATNYNEAARDYTHHLYFYLGNVTEFYQPAQYPLFISDFALYWYNYVGGYDCVFCQFLGNDIRQITAGLCRGAAKTLNKTWGVMITWSTLNDLDSWVENPDRIYNDMVLAYQNGAKYIIVFNSPGFTLDENGQPVPNPEPAEYGTLTAEHLKKMQHFWNQVKAQLISKTFYADSAYVLPADYGFGFRKSEDRIWDKWDADELSQPIWNDIDVLIQEQNMNLDIIYETKIWNITINHPYDTLIFWNGTRIIK